MKREQRHIEARKIRLNKSSGKFERTIAKLGRVNSQMESDRQLLLSRISKPSWEVLFSTSIVYDFIDSTSLSHDSDGTFYRK